MTKSNDPKKAIKEKAKAHEIALEKLARLLGELIAKRWVQKHSAPQVHEEKAKQTPIDS